MLRYREAALDLLKRGWPLGEESKYDTNHALVLCRMHGFSPGLRFLYEHMRLFREVLQVLLHANQPKRSCQSTQSCMQTSQELLSERLSERLSEHTTRACMRTCPRAPVTAHNKGLDAMFTPHHSKVLQACFCKATTMSPVVATTTQRILSP